MQLTGDEIRRLTGVVVKVDRRRGEADGTRERHAVVRSSQRHIRHHPRMSVRLLPNNGSTEIDKKKQRKNRQNKISNLEIRHSSRFFEQEP